MAEETKVEDRKSQPRFSQFALAAARDTSAFEPRTASGEDVETSRSQAAAPEESPGARFNEEAGATGSATASPSAPKRSRAAKPPSPPPETEEELISFTVRLPASLYMRMRRALGLRERLGELCVAAITRELDLRR